MVGSCLTDRRQGKDNERRGLFGKAWVKAFGGVKGGWYNAGQGELNYCLDIHFIPLML